MPLQRDGIGKLRRDRQQRQHVAVAQLPLQAGLVELELFDIACGRRAGRVDALDQCLVRVGQHRRSARIAKHITHRLLRRLELVDGRRVKGTVQGDARPSGLEHHHVAGHQLHVLGLVALHQELVDVELGDHRSIAPQQHLAHRPAGAGAARRHHGRQQRRLARHGVDPRHARRAHHENLHPAQFAQGHVQVEVGIEPPDLRAQVPFQFRRLDAGHGEAADLGQIDLAIAVHGGAVVDVDTTPGANHHFVTRAHGVVAGHRNVVDRRETVGRVDKETGPEQRQLPPGGRLDELLELVGLDRHQLVATLQRIGAALPRKPSGTALRIQGLLAIACRGTRRSSGGIGRRIEGAAGRFVSGEARSSRQAHAEKKGQRPEGRRRAKAEQGHAKRTHEGPRGPGKSG